MENIRNFVNGITGNDQQKSNVTNASPNRSIPRVIDGQFDRTLTNINHLGAVEGPRNRTESESSSTSMASSTGTQKDKDSYFWVM